MARRASTRAASPSARRSIPPIQAAADTALRDGLIAYDRRHGWRGPYAKIPDMSVWEEEFARIAQRRPLFGPPAWQLAVVNKVEAQSVQIVGLPGGEANGEGTIPFAEMTWARPTLADQRVGNPPRAPRDVVSVGDVVVVEKVDKPAGRRHAGQRQALSAEDLRAAPGAQRRGRRGDHGHPDRPRARHVGRLGLRPQPVQPRRPGRAPARLGVQAVRLSWRRWTRASRPASVVLDAPFSYDPGHGQPIWTPKNYGGDFLGPATVRRGLELSRNLMTVRMAQQIGMKRVVEVAKEFGVTDNMGAYLPMAIGAGETTLAAHDHGLRHAGQRRARDHAEPRRPRAGPQRQDHLSPRAARLQGLRRRRRAGRPSRLPPELIDSRKPFHDPASVYQVVSMMQGVTVRGTAGRLAALGRPIAGKTGTTNDARDNWFLGSTPDITIGIYIGFDEPRNLGAAGDRRRQCRADLRADRQGDLQGQAADAVPHPAGPAHGALHLRGRHRSTRSSSPAPSPARTATW